LPVCRRRLESRNKGGLSFTVSLLEVLLVACLALSAVHAQEATCALKLQASPSSGGHVMGSGQIYLIYLTCLDDGTRSRVISRLQANNIAYTEVTDWTAYNALITNPPKNAVVIFLTGECVPWDPSAFPSWKSLYLTIGKNVRDYGWTLMNEGGYAFFYAVSPDNKPTKTAEDGYNTMMNQLPGTQLSQWGPQRLSVHESLTEAGQIALNLVSGSPSNSYVEGRPTTWKGVKLIGSYYDSGGEFFGASAVQFGSGALFTMGWGMDEFSRGDIIVAAAMQIGSSWSYLSGATVRISAVPASGYAFSSWSGSGTGSYSGYSNPATIVMNSAISESASFVTDVEIRFQLSGVHSDAEGAVIIIDGAPYSYQQLPRSFTWRVGSTHTIDANGLVTGGSGKRYVWTTWSNASQIRSQTIDVTRPMTYTAVFRTQYLLTVSSPVGNPQGSSWYDESSTATFSVTSPSRAEGLLGILGGNHIFDRWSGDSSVTTANASITMDGPKTVTPEWRADNTIPLVVSAMIAAVSVVLAILAKRKRREPLSPEAQALLQPAAARYGEYLARLERLKAEGFISKRVYQRLRSEYQKKMG
jgi:hypothetical protein